MNNYKTRLMVSLVVAVMSTSFLGITLSEQFYPPETAIAQEANPTPTVATYATSTKVTPKVPPVAPGTLDSWLERLAMAESGNNATLHHLDVNGKYSDGCLQFQMGTWLSYGEEFGATPANIFNCDLQKAVAKDMIAKKYSSWRHWYNSSMKIGLPPR